MRILPYRGAALGLAVGFSRMADHTDRPKRKAKNAKERHGDERPLKKLSKAEKARRMAAVRATIDCTLVPNRAASAAGDGNVCPRKASCVHAKSTSSSCNRKGTLPAAWAQSKPNTAPFS